MSGGKRIELCSTDEVAPGAALKVEIEDLALAVFNVDGQFNIRTGEVVSPPCMVAIKTYPTLVVDGKVTIEV